MKYKDISWNLMINDEQASFDDSGLDFIAEEIQQGNTSGLFTTDCTNYAMCEELKEKLEQELGRQVDYNVDDNDKGELEDLLKIARRNKDNCVVELVEEILNEGFGDWIMSLDFVETIEERKYGSFYILLQEYTDENDKAVYNVSLEFMVDENLSKTLDLAESYNLEDMQKYFNTLVKNIESVNGIKG